MLTELTPEKLHALRLCLVDNLKNVSNKYDWDSAFVRWMFNFKQDKEDSFVIDQDNLIPANDLKYVADNFNIDADKVSDAFKKCFTQNVDKDKYKVKLDAKTIKFFKHKLMPIYKGKNFEKDLNTLLKMYWAVGMMTMSGEFTTLFLSVPPDIIRKHDLFELFGSPFNHVSKYCSPFVIDRNFGSNGNFFEYELEENTSYLANPPFDEHVMESMSKRLIEQCKKTKIKLLMITLPLWDSKSQRELKQKDYGLSFNAVELLVPANFPGYHFEHYKLLKYEHKYYSYGNEKLINASNTHLIIISQSKTTIRDDWMKIF